MNESNRFPACTNQAKLRPTENIGASYPRTQGLDGIKPPSIDDNNDDEPEEKKQCIVCDAAMFTRLIPVGNTDEMIHVECMYDDYFFCQCCEFLRRKIAWPVEELNDAGECPIHEGELGMSNEEEDDWDDCWENVQNNNY
jgi:hypothetical protein